MNLISRWSVVMAWRDARKSWPRLLFYISASSIGIAALVAAGSFHDNLEEALRLQAKPLVGADVVVRNRAPFDPASQEYFSSLPFPRLKEVELNTVVSFPDAQGSRLMEVRAIEKGFPFYGDVKTDPPNALEQVFGEPAVLIEENVMAEFGLTPGSQIELGRSQFRVAGALKLVPGEAMASVFSAPRAFIALPFLNDTGLISEQSLARHKIYFKVDSPDDLQTLLTSLEPKAKENSWRVSTVAERQKNLGRRVENASRFLKMAALIALLLGGIGVASILYVYAKEKIVTAVTLRCLGASAIPTLMIFVLQGLVLGAMASLLGGVLGVGLQAVIPTLLKHFVFIEIPFFISWFSVLSGVLMGFTLTTLFSLLPLLKLRLVSPLAALRFGNDLETSAKRDPGVCILGAIVFAVVFLFAKLQTSRAVLALGVPASIALSLLLLSLVTKILLKWLRVHVPETWPYPWRQGLANLFRPHNQTHALVAALGLGSALIFTIGFLNNSLLKHLSLSIKGGQPTLALIDIQNDQREGVRQILSKHQTEITDQVAFVTMRIEKIKGETVTTGDESQTSRRPEWALRREYRSTYRSTVSPTETLIKGTWPPPPWAPDAAVPISMEEGIAEDLGLKLGDELTFNVQGLPISTVLVALRRVDWFQLRPNFFVIFPEGVLEQAPQFTVILARVGSVQATAALQKEIRQIFPNISTVDLRMVLETLNNYFGKVALALRFMALFVVITGLLILAGTLVSGRLERLKEAALLRTLGAPSAVITQIHLIEYALIGLLAGMAGLCLALASSFFTSRHLLEITFTPGIGPAFIGLAALVAISVFTGLFLGRSMLNRPPLETLREEE